MELVEAKLSNTEKRPVSSRGRARFWKGSWMPHTQKQFAEKQPILNCSRKVSECAGCGPRFLFRAYLFVVSFPALRSQIAFIAPYRLELKVKQSEENFLVSIFDPKVPQKPSQSIWFKNIFWGACCCVLTHTQQPFPPPLQMCSAASSDSHFLKVGCCVALNTKRFTVR